jgi:hypothetical protein
MARHQKEAEVSPTGGAEVGKDTPSGFSQQRAQALLAARSAVARLAQPSAKPAAVSL